MANTPMQHEPPTAEVSLDDVVELAERWLTESTQYPVDPAAQQLSDLLADPRGLEFTTGFVDGVIRPEDPRVAAAKLAELARDVPAFVPWHLRAALQVGARAGAEFPHLVIPVAQAALRRLVGHLVVDARPRPLADTIQRIRAKGARPNINLLGEAVLGNDEATRRVANQRDLLNRDDVDYVSVKVSTTIGPHQAWAFDEVVADVIERLTPLYADAAAASTPKFINLDMEEYRDLDLTIAVFTGLLDRPEFQGLEAGIVLQAYLPDALGAMQHLQQWAARRVADGGAPIKVRVVKGANLPMERVDAAMHDWPLTVCDSKQATDTNYKRVLEYALRPEHVANVRIGVAGHNIFDLAWAWLLAGKRDARHGMEVEMLLGMAQGQAEAIRREVGELLLYTPVVHPREFDVAIAYLVRRLEEGASEENFMSAAFDLPGDAHLLTRERERFAAALADLDPDAPVPTPNRTQNRADETNTPQSGPFANTPDSDPSLAPNRAWARSIAAAIPASDLGVQQITEAAVGDAAALEQILARGAAAGPQWAARPASERADLLRAAGAVLADRRGELMEVAGSECGKTLDQSDVEVSEAIDFANYYASCAGELDEVDGAEFTPAGLTVITPPWNFPLAIPCGGVLAALAAGSAVIIKPAGAAKRCGAVLVQALWDAGIPRDVLQLVDVPENDLGRQLVADERVDRVVLTGAYETAALFRGFRPDMELMAETSGKNALVVTPSADLDLAVADLVKSAFGHAGQKCSAASLCITVGSVSRSRRFRTQLIDAVRSLVVGMPDDLRTEMGPLTEAATGKLRRALTTLEDGQTWLVEPRQLDAEGRLWSPGVRTGVRPGSEYHLTEYFGPVLGLMHADTLDEAIELQNRVDYGLTAGIHSLDPDEVAYWVDHVAAGNLYVNRGITGAIVQRQPFGGWKRSSVGAGTKAGGPSYLFGFGDWRSAEAKSGAPLSEDVRELLAAAESADLDVQRMGRAFRSDAAAWRQRYSRADDISAIWAEQNVLRYRRTPVLVRLAEGGSIDDLVRVLGAGLCTGSPLRVSTRVDLPTPIIEVLRRHGVEVDVCDDRAWLASLDAESDRVRLVGGDASAVLARTADRPDLGIHHQPVTESGRVELLPFLREQAVSATAHRFGTPRPVWKP